MNLRRLGGLVPASILLLAVACGTASQSQSSVATGQRDDTSVVARIGDREITMAELDGKVLTSNVKVFQELYDARRQALGELVADALLAQEAESRGVSVEDLVEQEVTSKVAPVSDDDVEAFFNENRARLGGQTLEQIGGQIREYMAARNEAVVRQSFIDGLRSEREVQIALEPPKVPITVAGDERIRGSGDAAVTIVEYADFQ